MTERTPRKEAERYQPSFSPFMEGYQAVLATNESDREQIALITDQFQQLPNAMWKRLALRRMVADMATEGTVHAEPEGEKTVPIVSDASDRQERAHSVLESIIQTDTVPTPLPYDTYTFLGQWNKAVLTATNREETLAKLRSLRRTFTAGHINKTCLLTLEEDPGDGSFVLFDFPKNGDYYSPEYTKLIRPRRFNDERITPRIKLPPYRDRIAAITTSDPEVRRQFSTQNDLSLRQTVHRFGAYLRPFSIGFSRLPPPSEMRQLAIQFGYTQPQLVQEFEIQQSEISRRIAQYPDQYEPSVKEIDEVFKTDGSPTNAEAARQPKSIRSVWNDIRSVRREGHHISVKSPGDEFSPLLDRALHIAERLRLEHSDWIHEQMKSIAAHIGDHGDEEAHQAIEKRYITALKRTVLLKLRHTKETSADGTLPPVTDDELHDTVIGTTLDFMSMMRTCIRRQIPPRTSLKLAERIHRFSPLSLETYIQEYPHVPPNLIAFAMSKSIRNVSDFLNDLNRRTAEFRANPEYTRITTANIAQSLFGRTDEYARNALERFKNIPKKEQARVDAERRRILGRATRRTKRTRVYTRRPPNPPSAAEPAPEPWERPPKFVPQFPDRALFETVIPSIAEDILAEKIDQFGPEEQLVLYEYISQVHQGNTEPDVIANMANGDIMAASRIRGLVRRLNRMID